MKKLLILGGTQFIGRNLIERIIEMEELDITLFNRQETLANLFPEIKKIKGDRNTNDISRISKENWDFIIDISCYYPDSLHNTLKYLNNGIRKYIFISTCSVYDNDRNKNYLNDEKAKLKKCNVNQRQDRNSDTYANRKAECERILKSSGVNYLILRPSLVYGKYDYTDRFYYWLYQIKHHKVLLLPDNGESKFSLTYVSDLVGSIVEVLFSNIENNIYNVVSYPIISIGKIVECTMEVLNSKNELVNAKSDFLKSNEVNQWFNMPLWLDGDFFTFSNQKYKNDFQLELTEFKKSIKETINYYESLGWPKPTYGMTEKVRTRLLKKLT